MRLINDFFDRVETETVDSGFRCKVAFRAEHGIYRIHFPGYPVTPGVCLMQMAAEILEQQTGYHLQLRTITNIKFRKAVTPELTPTFIFNKVALEEGMLNVRVSVEDDETQYVSMSLKYNVIDPQ